MDPKIVALSALFFLQSCDTGDTPAKTHDRTLVQLQKSSIPEERQNEAAAWGHYGIARATAVRTDDIGTKHRVKLFADDGNTIGDVIIRDQEGSASSYNRRIVVTIGGDQVSIDINEAQGGLRVTDLTTGRIGFVRADLEQQAFDTDPTAKHIFEAYPHAMPIAFGLYADLEQGRQALRSTEEKKTAVDTVTETRADALISECCGAWRRGSSAWTTRSGCCQRTAMDLQRQCSNLYCVGCCHTLQCDTACVPSLGDYFCMCGQYGRSCGFCY